MTQKELYAAIPKVDELLDAKALAGAVSAFSRPVVRRAIQQIADGLRKDIAGGKVTAAPDAAWWHTRVAAVADESQRVAMERVVNATGVILHTGLGRAVMPPAAVAAIAEHVAGYCEVEIRRDNGKRGRRETIVQGLLRELTGCESATIVNNNAAATMLILAALASTPGRNEVIVSRGELVEIGGSFRIPDVMAQSGAKLVEVGATNKTHRKDYEQAITDATGMLLKVHTSNYRIIGFTEEVPLEELAALGKARGIPVCHDIGSGALVDLAGLGFLPEPLAKDSLDKGAGIACFSGDKLLGGPQAGIILGKKDLVERCAQHPLYRAFRCDKLILVALEAVLRLYLRGDGVFEQIPTLGMLKATASDIRARAESLAAQLRNVPDVTATIEQDTSRLGSGALPMVDIPTWVVVVEHKSLDPQALQTALRCGGRPAIYVRVRDEKVALDPRTLLPGEPETIVKRFGELGAA